MPECSCRCRHPVTKRRALCLVIDRSLYERHGRDWCGAIERWPQCQRKDNYGSTQPVPMLFVKMD